MTLSRKEFLGFYKSEMEFSNIRGIATTKGHHNELQGMYDIYMDSSNDEEFTDKMTSAGYGKLN